MNPSKSIPILIIKEDENEIVLTQSIAILEYLEESLPTLAPLLPPSGDLVQRARVREMVNIITKDIQPITNGRIAKRIRAIRGKAKDQIIFVTGGQFSIGDVVTMADVCFAPAVEMALAYGTNLDGLPRVMGLFKKLGELPAFQKGNWKGQGDTPEAMRGP
ncbi:Glutathione S-transferase/chloride channel C-terminal [Penicillium freii]|nr:Glutathione S-transferase/chloride channel C-terminal [Penicillium freii]